jgi:hypothetical protein
MPVARATGVWIARMRATAYARLEEIRFRTGVLALAALAAVLGAAAAVAVVAAVSGPPAAHRPLAGQARAALPPVRVRPALPPRKPGRLAPPARHAGPAGRTRSSSYLASSAPRHVASSAPRPNFTGRHGQRQFGRHGHFAWRGWWHHHFARHNWWRHGGDPRHGWHPHHDRGPVRRRSDQAAPINDRASAGPTTRS